MKKHRYLSDRSGCLECGFHYEGPKDPRHFKEPPPPRVIDCMGYHTWGEWQPFDHGRYKICTYCSHIMRQTHVGWTFLSGGPL